MTTTAELGQRSGWRSPYRESAGGGKRYEMISSDEYDGTHTVFFGYVFWLVGFTGAHRFYYGKVATGILWFFTLGLFGIGWLVDLLLIPDMDRAARDQFAPGRIDYNAAWLLLVFAGPFGLHRFVQGKFATGLIYLVTLGLLGVGVIYDVLTLNDQIHSKNYAAFRGRQ